MWKQLDSRAWIGLALVLAIACMSCGVKTGDSPFDPVNLGSVAVVVSPSDLDAPWTMDGPIGTHHEGHGTTTIGSLPAGAYTVTWGHTAGYTTPPPAGGTLAAGGLATITGDYVQLAPGTIHINCSPVDFEAPWLLEWNDGAASLAGNGTANLTGRLAGDYVIRWQAVAGWYSPSPAFQAFALDPGGEATVGGTWAPLPPGSVQINPDPDNLNAPWTLTGPGGYQVSGTGDGVRTSLPTGSYSLLWGAVDGWTSPSPALMTDTLAAGGLLVFPGTYVQVPPVTIGVDVTPNDMAANWTVTGPGSFSLTQAGDWSLGGLPAGQYSVTWGDAGTGWYNPSPMTSSSTVAASGSHTFSATYTQIPPVTVVVDVTPNTVTALWTLTGPNGYLLSRSGDWTQTGLAAGQYVLTWGDAGTSWVMPSPASLSYTISAGGSHTFSGTYVAILPVTVGVDVTPNATTAQWTVTGPNGFTVTRAGDWSQNGLTPGQYSITWGSAGSDWTTPAPATSSQSVASGGSHTFTGTYVAVPRIGLFTTNSGASLVSTTTWGGVWNVWAYLVIINPDPSGIAYWHAAVDTDGRTSIIEDPITAGTAYGGTPTPAGVFAVQLATPLPPNGSNAVHVASVRLWNFANYTGGSCTATLGSYSEVGGVSLSLPQYAPGNNPSARISMQPFNGSWSLPAFTVNP